MEPDRKLTVEEISELALFLYKEGVSLDRQGDPYHVGIRYAQSLSVFMHLDQLNAVRTNAGRPNEFWLAALLYRLGKLRGRSGETKQVRAFFEAAVYLHQRLEEKDATPELWLSLGRAFTQLGDYLRAQRLIERATDLYQKRGQPEQAVALENELKKSSELSDQQTYRLASIPSEDQAHEFTIRVHEQAKEKFVVTPEGDVQWGVVPGFDSPVVYDLNGWEVVCTDS